MSEPTPKENTQPPQAAINALFSRLLAEAEAGGYHLNPDIEFTKDLVAGLLINEKRYGYLNCPCRLASGDRQKDLDIICPCDYRDPDIAEYGACYCALYVNDKIFNGQQQARTIPERRGRKKMNTIKPTEKTGAALFANLSVPVWRCKVCGYLCGRDSPPEKCPICKVPKERFERFIG